MTDTTPVKKVSIVRPPPGVIQKSTGDAATTRKEGFIPPLSCLLQRKAPPSRPKPSPIATADKQPFQRQTPQQQSQSFPNGGRKRPFQQQQQQQPVQGQGRPEERSKRAQNSGPPQKKARQIFEFGNYDRYYGYRNAEDKFHDNRIDLLKKDYFEGKRCLDIGCNIGLVSIAIAKKFKPEHILGIDIDKSLIDSALAGLERDKRRAERKHAKYLEHNNNNKHTKHIKFDDDSSPPSEESSKPVHQQQTEDNKQSSANTEEEKEEKQKGKKTQDEDQENGETAQHAEQKAERPRYPFNIDFREENFVCDTKHHEQYDVILCFSVTKWIHLNWGDEGIKTLFSKIYGLLKEGGLLILEPQAWKSYKKKALLPKHKQNMKSVQLKPGLFRHHLLNEVGFKSIETLKHGLPPPKPKQQQQPQPRKNEEEEEKEKEKEDLKGEEEGEEKKESNRSDEAHKKETTTPKGFERGIYVYTK